MTEQLSNPLEQLAFIIPVRVDTPDRLWNLSTILRFIAQRLTGAEVVIVEQDAGSKLIELLARHPDVRHVLKDDGGPFRKADCVNAGAIATSRRFVCMYDTDILLEPAAIHRGLSALRDEGWRLVLPFNRIFLDIRGALRSKLGDSLDPANLGRVRRMRDMLGQPEVTTRFVEGGIFIADRETFLAEGGLNLKMVSYGWEDTEMQKRFRKLGYPILHLPDYNLIHLDHRRGADSKPNEHYDANRQEFLKVNAMSASDLARYVASDLSITALGQGQRLTTLRTAQRSANRLGLLHVKAFWALLVIHVRAYGLGFLTDRLRRLGKA